MSTATNAASRQPVSDTFEVNQKICHFTSNQSIVDVV